MDRRLIDAGTGREKTRLLHALALHDAETDPLIRKIAVELVRSAPRDDHLERIKRLHRFGQTWEYHGEPIEMFAPSTMTLTEGGDCDDHARTLAAMAWTLRYPFIIKPIGNLDNPKHYTTLLGIPPALVPWGDRETQWFNTETTVPIPFGMDVRALMPETWGPQ